MNPPAVHTEAHPTNAQEVTTDLLHVLGSELMGTSSPGDTKPHWSGGKVEFQEVPSGGNGQKQKPSLNLKLSNVTLELENVSLFAPTSLPAFGSSNADARSTIPAGGPSFLWPAFQQMLAQSSELEEQVEAPVHPHHDHATPTPALSSVASEETPLATPKKGKGKGYTREFRSSSHFEERTSKDEEPKEMTIDQLKDFIDGDILSMRDTYFGSEDEMKGIVDGTQKQLPIQKRKGKATGNNNLVNNHVPLSGWGDPQPLPSNTFYDQFLSELRKGGMDKDLPLPPNPPAGLAVGGTTPLPVLHPEESRGAPLPNTIFDQFLRELRSHSTDPTPPLPLVQGQSGEKSQIPVHPAVASPAHPSSKPRTRRSNPPTATMYDEEDAEVIKLPKGDLDFVGIVTSKLGPKGLNKKTRKAQQLENAEDNEILQHEIPGPTAFIVEVPEDGHDDDRSSHGKYGQVPKPAPKEYHKYPTKYAKNAPRYPPLDREKLYNDGLLLYLKDFRLNPVHS